MWSIIYLEQKQEKIQKKEKLKKKLLLLKKFKKKHKFKKILSEKILVTCTYLYVYIHTKYLRNICL